jgi:hypothetical protein
MGEDLLSLEGFLCSGRRNSWLVYPHLKVYVRNSSRYFEGNLIHPMDIANIEVDRD